MKNRGKILVCGGAGYIGGCLTDLFTQSGYSVTVYDNLTYETRYLKNTPFINGDIRDKEKLGGIINDYDIVIWLAALVGDGVCAANPALTEEINFSSVQWLVKNYSGKIIFMSTCSIYGINNALSNESSPANPLSLYAVTKLRAEKEIVKHAKSFLIFRLGTLFGIGDNHSRMRLDLVVNSLAKKAVLKEPLSVFGGGQWRPLLHVKDVVEAILFGIEKNITGLFNLSNKNYQIREIAQEIEKIIPQTKIEYQNMKFEDLRDYKVTSEKFRAYGWQPKYDLEYGIREIYQVIKEGRIKDPNDALYSNAAYFKNKVV